MMKFALIVLGWLWMIFGIWWFFRPARIRKKFERSYRKKMRWLLFTVMFVAAGVIYGAGRQLGGWLGMLFFVVAIIAMLKGLFFVSGKTSEKVLEWWGNQPDKVYRICAAGLFLMGLLTQWLFAAG